MWSAEMVSQRTKVGRLASGFGLLIVLAVAGCGFHLRGVTSIPPALERPYIEGVGENDALGRELRALLQVNGATPVDEPTDASAIITIHDQHRRREVRAIGGSGGAREFELIYRVSFSARGGATPFQLERTEILRSGSFSYAEQEALQRAEGERLVEQDLVQDAAQGIVERIRAEMAG